MPSTIDETVPRPRIEGLSDLIFGLALSIGALSLLAKPPSNAYEVGADILGFGFSFLILISVWIRYTSIMSVLPIETSVTHALNIILMFLVSLEPYLFNLVSQYGHVVDNSLVDSSSMLFAIDMGGLMVIMAFFMHQLTMEERKLIPPRLMSSYKRSRNTLFLSSVFFFITILPLFWTIKIEQTPLRFYFWAIPLIIVWARRLSEGRAAPRISKPSKHEKEAHRSG